MLAMLASPLMAQHEGGGEANLVLPDLDSATFLGGIGGRTLLMGGLVVSALGLVFGLMIFMRLRNMPVHTSMREVSELIYETCKTYLLTQGKFLLLLECFIGGHHRLLLRVPAGLRGLQGADHSAVQPGRHLGQLPGGGVRHAREHVRQLAHGLRQPDAASRTPATTFRCRPA